jgi:FkbM family methyltransferase
VNLLRESPLSFRRKIEFLAKKYFILVKHSVVPFKIGSSNISLFGRKHYYVGRFGIAGFQRILTTHYSMLKNNVGQFSQLHTVIDIGASIGEFTKMLRVINKDADIFSVEPNPFAYGCLVKNVKHDSKIRTYNSAIANKDTIIKMKLPENSSWLSHISQDGVDIKALTLDSFCSENHIRKIDLIKVDVEGFEHFVFEGGKETLKSTKYIITEVSVANNTRYTLSKLLSLLNSSEFNFQLLDFIAHRDIKSHKILAMDLLLRNELLSAR